MRLNGKRSDVAGFERQVEHLKSPRSSAVPAAQYLGDAAGSHEFPRLFEQGKETATSRLGERLKACPMKEEHGVTMLRRGSP